MSSGKHRRSARILELDARRSQQAEGQNKDKETCEVKTEDVITEEDHFSLKRGRKRAKIRPVQNLVVNKVEDQVEKVGNSSNEDRHTNAAVASSETALPERRKLDMLLGILQRRDSHKIFAEPVDSEEVKGYYDIIDEPMDFGTISMKLNGGSYKTLDEFEHDVFLVSSNAMFFNHSNTIYYRQARAIRDLAKKLFDALKTDPENFGSELSMARLRAGYRDERRSINFEEDRRGTYRASGSFLNENESIVSSVFNSSKPLVKIMQNNIGYKESLLRFVKDLGPTAQFIAWQKLKRCTTEVYNHQTGTPLRKLQTQEHQIPHVASLRKNNTAASSSNFLKNSTTKNFSGKMNILGNTSYAGKASQFDTTNMNDVLSSRFAQATNSTKNPVDYNGKSVQTLRDRTAILKQDMAGQGIGNPNFPTSSLGDGNPYLSTTWSTRSNHDEYSSSTINKGKNVQMADPASSYAMRNSVAPHRKSIQAIREEATAFNEKVADQGTGNSYFFTALLDDRKSYLSDTPNTYNDPEKFISGANNKGKNVQIAEVSSSHSMEHPDGNCGKSEQGMRQRGAVFNADMTDQGSGSAYLSTDLFGALSATQSTHSNPDKSIFRALNKGKNVLIAEVNSLDPMDPDDYNRKSVPGMRELGASFKADMSHQSIGGSFSSTPLPIDETSYLPAARHTLNNTGGLIASAFDESQNDQMTEIASSDPKMLESLFASNYGAASSKSQQWLPPAMGSSWSQAQSTRGLYSNYIGGEVQQVQARAGRGGANIEGKVVQAGQAWNWFMPTQLGPHPILSSSFQEQSEPTKVDLAGQAGSSKWGEWGSTTSNGQLVEGSFMNESHQTSNQQGDLSIGASLGNNYLQQSPLGTKYYRQSPLENNYRQQSPLGNNYQQQSSLVTNNQQQSPLANNYRQQSLLGNDHQQQFPLGNDYQQQFPLENDYRQHSPLANNYRRQSSLGNSYQQQSSLANDNGRQSSLVANDYQQQSSLANDYGRQSSLVANDYQQQSPLASNYERQYSLGNNRQQKSSLTNNYQQQSLMINKHRRQSPLGNNYRQQSPLASNYQQQSPLVNNYKQQYPLSNNYRPQSRFGNDYRQQTPVDANMLHQRFRL